MSPLPHRRRTAPLVLAAAAALLLVPACANGDNESPSTPTSPAATSPASPSPSPDTAKRITTKNFAFSPATLTVRAGEKVTVVNEDSVAHTVTATEGKAFDTGSIEGGRSGTFTAPSAPGSYPFVCTFHPYMKGTLIVR